MNKSIFENQPSLVENEGQVVRINFDVEKVTEVQPSMDGGDDIEIEVYKAYVIRVAAPASVETIKAAVVANGFSDVKAETVACDVMIELSSDDETKLAYAKQKVLAQIAAYDKSDAVNEFSYNGVNMWLDKDTRAGLIMRFNAEKTAGKETTSLWYGGQTFTLAITDGLAMVNALEVYASACFDNTEQHKANVNALTTVAEVEAYDYTVGYPAKLSF